jgi:hypothetical protein
LSQVPGVHRSECVEVQVLHGRSLIRHCRLL